MGSNQSTGESSDSDDELKEIQAQLDEYEPPIALGSCLLGRPDVAHTVQNALLYFEAQRYYLWAWCIMPNHVHVIVTPTSHTLSQIEHSWKSFTSHRIGKMCGTRGAIWERETFDHAIRTPESLAWLIEYVEMNPVAAKLRTQPEHWPFGNRGVAFRPSEHARFIDPRTLPFEAMRSRDELPHLHKPGSTYFLTFRLWDAVEYKKTAGETPAPQHTRR